MIKSFFLPALLLGAAGILHANVVIDFEDLSLPPNSYHNNSPFISEGASFNNIYSNEGWEFWGGFSYSNMRDTTTPGYLNQYSAVAPSTGIYAVGFMDTYSGTSSTIGLPLGYTEPLSLKITNTTYAYYAMENGEGGASAFTQGDWFKLTIEGKSTSGESLGTIEYYLADFRSEEASEWYILNTWMTVDLTALGNGVGSLVFTLASSDAGIWGINTPTYFAMDDLVMVPEPSIVLLVAGAGLFLTWIGKRREEKARPINVA